MTSNQVVYLELHTADVGEASHFLSRLLGWRTEEVPAGDSSYTALSLGPHLGGGMVECGVRPAQWLPYVVVDHLDGATDRAERLGAAVLLEPREGPSGWRSVVNSPEGGMIALWQHRALIDR
jgi:predicted enzyme related to lactoylglutathione lyase